MENDEEDLNTNRPEIKENAMDAFTHAHAIMPAGELATRQAAKESPGPPS